MPISVIKSIGLFVIAISALLSSAETTTRKWNWLGSVGALCENVGVNGAFRVYVEAEVENGANGSITIKSMALWVKGAVVNKDSTTTTAKLEIKKSGTLLKTVNLSRPDPDQPSVEVDPQAGESRRLYLPSSQQTLEIPAGAKISFTVTAQQNSSSGACSLGVSKKEIDPFVP